MYNKKALSKASAELDKAKAPKKPKDMINDPMGQWKYPGLPTRIPSNDITMKGVGYPVLGVANNGQRKIMLPGADYTFPGADYVDEYPQMRKGGTKKKTRSLSGTNKIMLKHPLFENYKNRVYDPNADYFQKGGVKTVKSKDGTVTNRFINEAGDEVVQVKTKDGKYSEKIIPNDKYISPLTGKPYVPMQGDATIPSGWEAEDNTLEDIAEFIDPTGITSWDDVRRAYDENGLFDPKTGLEILGALPLVGKIGKSGKILAGGEKLFLDAVKYFGYNDKIANAYNAYRKLGGKNLDKVLGLTTKGLTKLSPKLNPEKWESSMKLINALNKFTEGTKATKLFSYFPSGDTQTKNDEEYVETELTDDEIEEYRKGGYIVEDISVPELNQAKEGGSQICPDGYIFDPNAGDNGLCVPESMYKYSNFKSNPKQKEKEIEENKKFRESYDYMEEYYNSPKYKEMLKKSSKNDDTYNYFLKSRNKQLQNTPPLKLLQQPLDDPSIGGQSVSETGEITIFPHGIGTEHTSEHELSHSSDRPLPGKERRLIPQKDIDYINKHKPKNTKDNQEYKDTGSYYANEKFYNDYYRDYVAYPTETRARLNSIRKAAKDNKLYDPFTEGLSPDTYNKKLKNFKFEKGDKEGFDPMNHLKNTFTDDEIIWMLNNISKKDDTNTDVPSGLTQAQKGGVKPYVAKNKKDYDFRKKAYDDSLGIYNLEQDYNKSSLKAANILNSNMTSKEDPYMNLIKKMNHISELQHNIVKNSNVPHKTVLAKARLKGDRGRVHVQPKQIIIKPNEENFGVIKQNPKPISKKSKVVDIPVKATYEDSISSYDNYLKRKDLLTSLKPDQFKSKKEIDDFLKKETLKYPTNPSLALKTKSVKKEFVYPKGKTTIALEDYMKPEGLQSSKLKSSMVDKSNNAIQLNKVNKSAYPKGYQPYSLYGKILDPEVYGYGESINEKPIEAAQFLDTQGYKAKMNKYKKSGKYPWVKQKGGVVAELSDDEIQDYINQGYIVEEIDEPEMQSGGELPYKIWEEKTGTPWSEAKRQGLTDGSYEQNVALAQKLLADATSVVKENLESKPSFDYNKYDQIVSTLVQKGNTLEDLVAQQIGTKEGLMKRYPNLFSASNSKSKAVNTANIPVRSVDEILKRTAAPVNLKTPDSRIKSETIQYQNIPVKKLNLISDSNLKPKPVNNTVKQFEKSKQVNQTKLKEAELKNYVNTIRDSLTPDSIKKQKQLQNSFFPTAPKKKLTVKEPLTQESTQEFKARMLKIQQGLNLKPIQTNPEKIAPIKNFQDLQGEPGKFDIVSPNLPEVNGKQFPVKKPVVKAKPPQDITKFQNTLKPEISFKKGSKITEVKPEIEEKVVKEDSGYKVISNLTNRIGSYDQSLQNLYYDYTNPKHSPEKRKQVKAAFDNKLKERNNLVTTINSKKRDYAGVLDSWIDESAPAWIKKPAQKMDLSDQVEASSYKLPKFETYKEKEEKENEKFRTSKRFDDLGGNEKGSRWQFRVAASNDDPMKVQVYGTRSERNPNLNIKSKGAVMHFLDQSPLTGYVHPTTQAYYRDLKPDGFVGKLEKQKDGNYTVKYVPKKDIPAKDLYKNTFLVRQEKFDNIDFNKKVADRNFLGHTYWTKKGSTKATIPVSSGKDANVYDYASGQSVVFIFPYKGKTRYVHYAGSPNAIKKEGEEIKKLYKLQANKLVLGVADAGSYSSSVKGNITDKKLKDWSYGYANTNGFTGAGMALVD